jgi:nucleoid-associated protein YgaU
MLKLRKDLQLGIGLSLAIVAVLGVYFLLTALTGTSAPQVAVASGDPSGSNNNSNNNSTINSTIVVPTPGGTNDKSLVASAEQGKPEAKTEVPVAKPEITISDQSKDPWSRAFSTGNVEPTTTVTPDPRSARQANNAADSQLIRGINEQKADQNSVAREVANASGTSNATGSLNTTPDRPQLTPPANAPSTAQVHTVENGDTLTSIAAQYYGDGRKFKLIVDANPGINPNRLRLGAKLSIPALATVVNDAPAADPMAPVTLDPTKQYKVQVGDSLQKIAFNLYGTSSSWTKLYEANKQLIGPDPAKLKLGTVLNLPEVPTKQQ